MKICIWCRRTEEQAPFNKLAHTLPQSLGGKNICKDVCDKCNAYFGSPQQAKPAVEVVLKEALQVTRFRFLNSAERLKKGHSAGRYTSTYFKADFNVKPHTFRLKPAYNFRPHFQELIARQLKRGLYKVFLEETQRQRGNALDDRFDFIREFARYDLNDDLPLLHFERSAGAILMTKDDLLKPELFMQDDYRSRYLREEYGFFEFDLVCHVFSIATSKLWHLNFDEYIKNSLTAKEGLFNGYRLVNAFDDIDLIMSRSFL